MTEISQLNEWSNGVKLIDSSFWHNVRQCEQVHIVEVLEQLENGTIDDDIWGKIVLMEKCKRLAKVYIRRTTVIIDGSSDEYDGDILGFNHFVGDTADDGVEQIRRKIADGVILKVDENGSVKALARGLAPVIVQDWDVPDSKCLTQRLLDQRGRLKTAKERLSGVTDRQRVEKIFDMGLFNVAVENELGLAEPDVVELMLKTCTRVSLVKESRCSAFKTPCWFILINLVALDVLRTKLSVDDLALVGPRRLAATLQTLAYRDSSSHDIFPTTKLSVSVNDGQFNLNFTSTLFRNSDQQVTDSITVLRQVHNSRNSVTKTDKSLDGTIRSGNVRRHRSLSDSDESHNPCGRRNKRLKPPTGATAVDNAVSAASETSSGISSMGAMKNIEIVERWRQNASKYLDATKEEKSLNDDDSIRDSLPVFDVGVSPNPQEHSNFSGKMSNLFIKQKHLPRAAECFNRNHKYDLSHSKSTPDRGMMYSEEGSSGTTGPAGRAKVGPKIYLNRCQQPERFGEFDKNSFYTSKPVMSTQLTVNSPLFINDPAIFRRCRSKSAHPGECFRNDCPRQYHHQAEFWQQPEQVKPKLSGQPTPVWAAQLNQTNARRNGQKSAANSIWRPLQPKMIGAHNSDSNHVQNPVINTQNATNRPAAQVLKPSSVFRRSTSMGPRRYAEAVHFAQSSSNDTNRSDRNAHGTTEIFINPIYMVPSTATRTGRLSRSANWQSHNGHSNLPANGTNLPTTIGSNSCGDHHRNRMIASVAPMPIAIDQKLFSKNPNTKRHSSKSSKRFHFFD